MFSGKAASHLASSSNILSIVAFLRAELPACLPQKSEEQVRFSDLRMACLFCKRRDRFGIGEGVFGTAEYPNEVDEVSGNGVHQEERAFSNLHIGQREVCIALLA